MEYEEQNQGVYLSVIATVFCFWTSGGMNLVYKGTFFINEFLHISMSALG